MEHEKEQILKNDVTGSVMVVGGGIAGIQASLDLANSGYLVYLVEQRPAIGGVMAQLDKTFPTNDCAMCVISPKLVEAGRHLNIELFTMTEVGAVEGQAGNFTVKLLEHPRYVDLAKCTSCGECAKVCPIDTKNQFDEGLRDRKAAYKLYPQGMPGAYAIDKIGTAPCKATCPAHVSIQGYIALIHQGKYREAIELFREEHPFPGVCGRVCHHPCESACTRGDVEQPMAIEYLHRFIADCDYSGESPYIPPTAEKRAEKIAIVGSGPAGLSAAYFLAKKGYPVTIFEKLPVAGGMMAVGIPKYRLPRNLLATEIGIIEKMGVEIKTNVAFGTDITLESLKADGYRTVFLATGLHGSRKLGVPGEDLAGILPGTTFLRDAALGKFVSLGKKVVVVGGGNVAIDVALTAKRLGAGEVVMVCLESRDEMPAWDYEIEEALEENIEILNCFGPDNFAGANGKVTGIQFKRCTCVFDDNNCFNPQYDENDLQTLSADTVIVAIGQSAELEFVKSQGVTVTPRGGLQCDPITLQTPLECVFAGGDGVYGPKSVVEAVSCGKEAAISMDRYIQGQDLGEDRSQNWEYQKPAAGNELPQKRIPMQKLPVEKRHANFNEVSLGYLEAEALKEAERCLKCGVCSECYQCVKACLANAIDHDMKPKLTSIQVGSIILAPGFKPFDPTPHSSYAYVGHPNVVTSLEFERLLSASGPNQGHLVRPSDHKEPEKIAWLQCIGSRDINQCDHSYCSSVCCMYAAKQTVIAKEHSAHPLDTAVFYMDMRTHGKDFDRYYMRAQAEKNVRFVRARVHTVEPVQDDLLRLRYVTETGSIFEETFDMVVLSVGLSPLENAVELADKLGIALNTHKFAQSSGLAPVSTNREGIYVCGAFQGPKDIPQSVMEASASAAAAAENLASARGTLIRSKELPSELDISAQEPRIGVFVCNCGINIGGVADVPAIREYARTLPYVVHVEDNLFTCSQDTQDKMKVVIQENGINRVVVASCSPRTHEPLFQETIREAGLNKYLFEMANIRDQNTWVHMSDPQHATEKAKDLVRMAVAKAVYIEPLHQVSLPVKSSALIIGAGMAGMETAIGLARQGCHAYLVERSDVLGGNARFLAETWQGEAVAPYLDNLIRQVRAHPLVHVFLNTSATETTGIIGSFITRLKSNAADGQETVVEHGATILATGGHEYKPTEYLYGQHPDIFTHLDFDQALKADDARLKSASVATFIQCVGSRTQDRPSCSRMCCTHSLKSALKLKKRKPDMKVFVLYRDIRSYGFREDLYKEARKNGVLFIRFDETRSPELMLDANQRLSLTVVDPILGRTLNMQPDLVVLASAVLPNENKTLFDLFKVPVNADGFLVEAHSKLRPVDFSSEGIFMAGLAHYPKSLDESIAQAQASVSRAMTILSKDAIWVGGVVATVDPSRCAVCLTCVRACPYGVPQVHGEGHAVIEPAECHGCGVCASECPGKAISLQHFTDRQIIAKTDALFCKVA